MASHSHTSGKPTERWEPFTTHLVSWNSVSLTYDGQNPDLTSLPTEDPGELCPSFSRQRTHQASPFSTDPYSPSHGKAPQPVRFSKKCRRRKIAKFYKENAFFAAGGRSRPERPRSGDFFAFSLAFSLISTKFSAVFSCVTTVSSSS